MKTITNKLILLSLLLSVCLYSMADIAPDGGYVQKSWGNGTPYTPIYEKVTITQFGHLRVEGKTVSATNGALIAIVGMTIYSEVNNTVKLRNSLVNIVNVGDNKTMDVYGLAPGVYYIQVDAAMSYVSYVSVGTFSASTTFIPETYTSECVEPENDSIKNALRLNENTTIQGLLGFEVKNKNTELKRDEVDYYRFLLKNDSKTRFKLTRKGNNDFHSDIQFEVLYYNQDSTFTKLVNNLFMANVKNNLDTAINLPRGNYIIKCGGGYNFYADGYEIDYSINKAFPDTSEPNDTYDKAQLLFENEQRKGTLGFLNGDFDDYYSFTLTDYADVKINYTMDEWLKSAVPTYNFNNFWLYYFPDKMNPKPATLDNFIIPLAAGPYDVNNNFIYPNTKVINNSGEMQYACDAYDIKPQNLPSEGLVYKRLSPGTYYFRIKTRGLNYSAYSYNISWEKIKTYDFSVTPQDEPLNFEHTAYPEIVSGDTIKGILGLYTINDREKVNSKITVNKNVEDIFRYIQPQTGDLDVTLSATAFRDENLRKNIPVDYHYAVKLYRKNPNVALENCHKTTDFSFFKAIEVAPETCNKIVTFRDIPADAYYLKIEYFKLNDYFYSQSINSYDGYSTYNISLKPVPFYAGFEVAQFNNKVKFINTSNAREFSWEFGDGGTSGSQFPEHMYSKPGEYIVKQSILFSGNALPQTAKDTVIVSGIHDFIPKTISNVGKFTMSIYGGGLNENAAVSLTKNGNTLKPIKVEKAEMGRILAIFDNDTISEGLYDLSVIMPGMEPFLMPTSVLCEKETSAVVISSIEGSKRVRIGMPSTQYLVLQNTGNVDATGVNAYLYLPDFLNVEMELGDYKTLIDPNGSFTFNYPPLNKSYTIPNSEVLVMMENLKTEIHPDSVLNRPFQGKVIHIYIPKITAKDVKKIPFTITSSPAAGSRNVFLSTYVEQDNMFEYEFGTFTNYMNLNNLCDLFVASGNVDNIKSKLGDNALWDRTFDVVNYLVLKSIYDEGKYNGYIQSKVSSEAAKVLAYDGAISEKQLATVILALKRISVDFPAENTNNGIFNVSMYDVSKFNAIRKSYLEHSLKLNNRQSADYMDLYANTTINDSSRLVRLLNYVSILNPDVILPKMQTVGFRRIAKEEKTADWNKVDPSKIPDPAEKMKFWTNLASNIGIWFENLIKWFDPQPETRYGNPVVKEKDKVGKNKLHAMTDRVNDPFSTKEYLFRSSFDPNEKIGPDGFCNKRFIANQQQMNYQNKI